MKLLGRQAITIRRYVAQVIGLDGLPEAQTPTEIAAWASPQPPHDDVVITDPGFSAGNTRRRFFCFTEIRAVNEATGVPSDEVSWNGGIWRVFSVDPWGAVGTIPAHWEAECWLVQPIVPPTSS